MNLQQQLGEWYPLLSHVFDQEWMKTLGRRIGAVPKGDLAPAIDNVFRAFTLCPPSKVKVVQCLQDPYINGEADGLAMSSFGKMTPSLEVVFEEINRTHIHKRTQTHLDDWAVQGVLLINAVLTTNIGKSRAHQGWGWENFILEVFNVINNLSQPMVFMLWGKDAQSITPYLRHATRLADHMAVVGSDRLVLKSCHPQAQNYNPANKFVGCGHFEQANVFLMKHDISPVWWSDPLGQVVPHDGYWASPVTEAWSKWFDFVTSLNHKLDAKVDITQILCGYPPVPDKPHPFDTGLQSRYEDQLPF